MSCNTSVGHTHFYKCVGILYFWYIIKYLYFILLKIYLPPPKKTKKFILMLVFGNYANFSKLTLITVGVYKYTIIHSSDMDSSFILFLNSYSTIFLPYFTN